MAGGTFSILCSVRGYHIYKEICSQGKFREFEPLAKIAKISPREIFPPYGICKAYVCILQYVCIIFYTV